MYSLYFIAKNNLKKKKSDAAVLTGLIILAALLLYIGISTLSNMGKVVNKAYELTNAADWYMLNSAAAVENMEEIFENRNEIESFEKTPVYYVTQSGFIVNGEKSESDYSFMLAPAEEERNISRLYPEYEGVLSDDEILLPYYMKNALHVETGDKFCFVMDGRTYDFKVGGFHEDPLFANPMNVSTYKCYITGKRAEEIAAHESGVLSYMECKAKLKEGTDSNRFLMEISDEINEKLPETTQTFNFSFIWTSIRYGDTMSASIGMGVVLVFAVLLIGIALIITRFSIGNFCEMNIKNIGILRASGYKESQLLGSFVMEMFLVSMVGSIVGLCVSALAGSFLGRLMSSLVGLSWNRGFDFKSAAVVMAVCILVTMAVAWHSSRKCVKISILDALRSGIADHNFHKNYFPLEKSRQPLVMNLGLKSIFYAKAKNLGICLIVMLLGFVCCIGFGMYQDFAVDTDNMLKLVGMELGDVFYIGEELEEFGQEVETNPEVERVLYAGNGNIKLVYGDKEVSVTCDFWDRPDLLKNEVILQGRAPEFDNEIMLSMVICEELDIELGDIVYVKGTGKEMDYILCGIDQKINNMGRKALMTTAGEERLNGSSTCSQLCVYGKEGVSDEELAKLLNDTYPQRKAMEAVKMSGESLKPINLVLKLLCAIFIAVTAFVVSLVVFLLLKTKIIREKKNYGVYKALGFTTGQLLMQTVLSSLPVIFLGALLGVMVCDFGAGPLVGICLRTIGIYQYQIKVDGSFKIITVVFITVTAFLVAVLTSIRIRKIQPVKLLTEE